MKEHKNLKEETPKLLHQICFWHCRFQNDCAYKHQDPIKNVEVAEMAEKLKGLETVVQALTR